MQTDQTISNYTYEETVESGGNIKNILGKFLANWYWFVLTIILAYLLAFLYLRYQRPIYNAKAIVLIKDEKKGAGVSELSAFQDIGLMKGGSSLDNEIEIYKSRSLMMRVVHDLGLQTTYFTKGKIMSQELYKKSPVNAVLLSHDTLLNKLNPFKSKYK